MILAVHQIQKKRQYQSVFMDGVLANIPNLPAHTATTIPKLSITPCGITKLLMPLDPNKAKGPDRIPTQVLNQCAHMIAPILQRIYQSSISKGEVPGDWKTANIITVYKKGSKSIPANYRPLSLTSVPC